MAAVGDRAADAAAPVSPEIATLVGTIAVAIIGIISGVLVKRTRGPGDAEQIKLAQQEVASKVVVTAAALIDEIREQQVAQKVDYDLKLSDQRIRHDAEISALNQRITSMEDRHLRMLAALLSHAPWDSTAWARLRDDDPNWPPPPPLDTQP